MKIDWQAALKSKGVWGAVVALTASTLSALLHLDPQQATELLGTLTDIVQVGTQVVTVGGTALALYGRLTATKRLTTGLPLKAPSKEN